MRNAARIAATLLACLGLGLLAPAASGRSVVPDVVTITTPLGLHASLELLSIERGVPAGGIVLDGSIAPDDWTLVFRLALADDSEPVGSIPFLAVDAAGDGRPLAGGGVLPGADDAVSAVARAFPTEPDWMLVYFDLAGDLLLPGQRSDRFFVSWSTLFDGDRVGTLLQTGPTRPTTGEPPRAFFGAQVVPEPGTALLVALGLASLRRPRR
jgi:hypothetical protein